MAAERLAQDAVEMALGDRRPTRIEETLRAKAMAAEPVELALASIAARRFATRRTCHGRGRAAAATSPESILVILGVVLAVTGGGLLLLTWLSRRAADPLLR